MQTRDVLHDGQAQTTAALATGVQPHKALQRVLAVCGCNAGAAVAHAQHRVVRVSGQAHIDPRARRGVAQRVVDQVVQQCAQRVGVAQGGQAFALRETQVNAALFGHRRKRHHRVARQRRQRHHLAVGLARVGFKPSELQQLCRQPNGAVYAAVQLVQRSFAGGRVRLAHQLVLAA